MGVSAVIVVAQVLIFLLVRSTLEQQYKAEEQAAFSRNVRVLEALKASNTARLEALAPTISGLAGIAGGASGLSAEKVRNRFDSNWLTVNLDMGLESVAFFSADGSLVAGWDAAYELFDPDIQRRYALSALAVEKPGSAVICADDCRQIVFVPLLTPSGKPYIVALSSSLAEIIINFSQTTRSSLALLSENGDNPCCWGRTIVASSARSLVEKVLPRIAGAADHMHLLVKPMNVEYSGKTYSVSLTSVKNLATGAAEVVVEDVTERVASIRKTLATLLLVSLVLVSGTVALLLFLLWRPMSELRKLAEGLPLLAAREYSRLRRLVGEKYRHTSVPDEIDALDRAAVTVSEKLESMEIDLRRHSDALKRRAGELSEERDFVQSLLDTAQVIIVTLSDDLKVLRANDFGLRLLGLTQSQASDLAFSDLAVAIKRRDLKEMQKVVTGESARYRVESRARGGNNKVYSIDWLISRIAGDDGRILAVGQDITERKQAEARLTWLADHDSLTGLFNRTRCMHEFERALATAAGQPISFLQLSIDGFKEINSVHGYALGDQCLVKVAEILRDASWSAEHGSQFVAKLEGEEFAIVLDEFDAAQAEELAAALSKSVAAKTGKKGFPSLTISMGVSCFPEHGMTVRELMANADVAKEAAEKAGGGRAVVFAEAELSQQLVQHRIYWRKEIEAALRENRFILYYQPIVDVTHERVSYYECLLRMKDENGELVSPGKFMPVAEASSLMVQLEQRVLELAMTKLRELQAKKRDEILSVNLSGRSFDRDTLAADIGQLITQFEINPSRLMFEITETAAVANLAKARRLITELQALGAKLAFDDFGVGFTSFQYLKDLPVDTVKLDASFVQRVHRVADDQVLVRSMVEMLLGLGKTVVAEGVEEKACYDWLCKAGVHYIQGFYVGKPAAELLAVGK